MMNMKPSGVQWIGDIPSEWKLGKVKNRFYSTKTIVGNQVDDYERLALTLNGVIKRSKEANDGLQPEKFDGYQILKENELVFKLIDLANVATSRVGLSPYTGIVSPAYIVLHDRQNGCPRYAEYYFLSMWMHEVFNHLGGDGVRSSLNAKDLLNVPFPLISEVEQQAIVDYLDERCSKIDAIIAEATASIEEYKELKQAVIFEAVTKGLGKDAPMKNSGVEWIGEIPFDWNAIRIKYLLSEINNRSETGEEEPLSVSQVLGVVPSTMIAVANPASSTIGQKIVEPGDLVFNKLKAHLGVFFVSNYKGLVSPDYAVYRANERVNPKFLEYLFHTSACITEFKKYITGVAVGLMRLYTSDLFNIYVALPRRSEQEQIIYHLNDSVHKFDALISEKQALINDLQAYKKSLIYEVITGKRRVV